MKKIWTFLFALTLCVLTAVPAHALDYDIDPPDDYLFGQPTSEDTIYEQEDINVDRSKNVSLVPPGFGTPTSYLPNSGEYLTPNLVPGALSGGLVASVGSVNYPTVESSYSSGGSSYDSGSPGGVSSYDTSGNFEITSSPMDYGDSVVSYTEVTDDLYYSNGSLGKLEIPAIGLSVNIYEGTDSGTLAKGAGHFTDTSIWGGNVCLAAHNRGANNYFGQIHTLTEGDTITLTTALGTRSFSVTSVEKIGETDNSGTASTSDNRVTLFTCVRDEREYRWCVQAVEQ